MLPLLYEVEISVFADNSVKEKLRYSAMLVTLSLTSYKLMNANMSRAVAERTRSLEVKARHFLWLRCPLKMQKSIVKYINWNFPTHSPDGTPVPMRYLPDYFGLLFSFCSFDRWRTSALQSEWRVEHGRFVVHRSIWLRKLSWAKYECFVVILYNNWPL